MREWDLRWAVAGLAALAGAAMFALWPPTPRVTQENFGRIKPGMTRTEVEAILGSPGDYRTEPTFDPVPASPARSVWRAARGEWAPPGTTAAVWRGNGGVVVVFLDRCDTVQEAEYGQVYAVQQAPLEKLFWQAERQWRRWFPK